MKLISESPHDDQLVYSLTNLLYDIGVDADPYRQEDALAMILWSSNELELEMDALSHMTKDDKMALLISIEDAICAAMREAGMRVICEAVSRAQGGQARLNARSLCR